SDLVERSRLIECDVWNASLKSFPLADASSLSWKNNTVLTPLETAAIYFVPFSFILFSFFNVVDVHIEVRISTEPYRFCFDLCTVANLIYRSDFRYAELYDNLTGVVNKRDTVIHQYLNQLSLENI